MGWQWMGWEDPGAAVPQPIAAEIDAVQREELDKQRNAFKHEPKSTKPAKEKTKQITKWIKIRKIENMKNVTLISFL